MTERQWEPGVPLHKHPNDTEYGQCVRPLFQVINDNDDAGHLTRRYVKNQLLSSLSVQNEFPADWREYRSAWCFACDAGWTENFVTDGVTKCFICGKKGERHYAQ